MTAVTIKAAARQLGISPGQVRYWLSLGAPRVRRGGKGRGHCALVDPASISAWARTRTTPQQQHHQLAHDLVVAVADTLAARWRASSGPGKVRAAADVLTEFTILATTIRQRMGLPALRPDEVPPAIGKMAELLQHFPQSLQASGALKE